VSGIQEENNKVLEEKNNILKEEEKALEENMYLECPIFDPNLYHTFFRNSFK